MYLFASGLLLAQYTITGFDASAHVSEETVGARTEAPKAIVRAIYVSAIAAFFLNLAMTAALPKKGAVDANGADIYAGIVFGNANDPFLVNAAPRLISLSVGIRDGQVPRLHLHRRPVLLRHGLGHGQQPHDLCVQPRRRVARARSTGTGSTRKTRTPTNSIWLGVVLSAIVGATSLYVAGHGAGRYSTAFFAMTGICVIGLYIAYAIPIYLRLTNPDFQPGPWNLKGHHKIVGWTVSIWIGFITILFFAPLFWPFWPIWGDKNLIADDGAGNVFFKQNNFNFTGPLILLAFIGMWLYWRLSARKWFTGPRVQGTKEELMAIERELESLS